MTTTALELSLEYITSWLDYRFDRETMPGLAIGIAHKGELVYEHYRGLANVATAESLTADHAFRIASQSKTFTATAIMQLQEAKKLQLDEYAVQYLPWLAEHRDARWKLVTIRQLLSHSAGVIRDGHDADYWQLARPFPDDSQLQAEVLAADLILDTNQKLKYSNIGYAILGAVVTAASGQPYAEYISQHILQPLNVSHTGVEPDASVKLATGYTRNEGSVGRLPIAPCNTWAMAAATGFYATASDLCQYYSAHVLGSGKLLTDESKKEMQRVHWSTDKVGDENRGYGLGFNVDVICDDLHVFGHGGGFPGYITKTYVIPDLELVVTVLTNSVDGPATPIARGICGIMKHFSNHTKPKTADHLTALCGRYMNVHSVCDFIVHDDTLSIADANSWHPISTKQSILEKIDSRTFKLTNTGNFDALDELVTFNISNGGIVTSVNYGGNTLLPEAVWLKHYRQQSIVAAPLP